MAIANKTKWKDPVKLQAAIDAYFNEFRGIETVTGLCLALGFWGRAGLQYWANEANEAETDVPDDVLELRRIFKTAKLRIENAYEIRLMTAKNPVGSIFALKNMGWSDNRQVEMSGKDGEAIPVTITGMVIKQG